METAFDSQSIWRHVDKIYSRERIERFDNKLYLEFGGKLFDDFHAARVLPGFDANAKIKLLMEPEGYYRDHLCYLCSGY